MQNRSNSTKFSLPIYSKYHIDKHSRSQILCALHISLNKKYLSHFCNQFQGLSPKLRVSIAKGMSISVLPMPCESHDSVASRSALSGHFPSDCNSLYNSSNWWRNRSIIDWFMSDCCWQNWFICSSNPSILSSIATICLVCLSGTHKCEKNNYDTTCLEDTRYHDGNIHITPQTRRCDEDYWGIPSACACVTKKS